MRPQAQSIVAFYRRAPPEDGVLLGKGPSLDRYDPNSATTAYVLGINNVATVIPCSGAIYLDAVYNDAVFPEKLDIFRPSGRSLRHSGRGYCFNWARLLKQQHRELPADCLLQFGPGTASLAAALLGAWGIRRLRLVGMDGVSGDPQGYTTKVPEIRPGRASPDHYVAIGQGVMRACQHYGMTVSIG